MIVDTVLLIAHETVCLALFGSVFCRFVRTNHRTRPAIRFAFWLMGVSALLGAAIPTIGGTLSWFGVFMTFAALLVQWVTSCYWQQAPPTAFQKDSHVSA